MKRNVAQLLAMSLAVLGHAPLVSAGDIAMDVRQTTVDSERGGYFEIGVGYEYSSNIGAEADGKGDQRSGAIVNLSGAYSYKNFFVEAVMESYEGVSLGYQLVVTDDWAVDLLASGLSGNFNVTGDSDAETADEQLLSRSSLYNGAGIRLTRYLGDSILQGRLVNDIDKGNGLSASARLARNWQLRNWNLHGIVSYDYASARTMQYLVGITDEEATDRFSAYSPKSGSSISLELGAAYPVSEHLVWKTDLLGTQYSDEVSNSPLLVDDRFIGLRTTLNYVF